MAAAAATVDLSRRSGLYQEVLESQRQQPSKGPLSDTQIISTIFYQCPLFIKIKFEGTEEEIARQQNSWMHLNRNITEIVEFLELRFDHDTSESEHDRINLFVRGYFPNIKTLRLVKFTQPITQGFVRTIDAVFNLLCLISPMSIKENQIQRAEQQLEFLTSDRIEDVLIKSKVTRLDLTNRNLYDLPLKILKKMFPNLELVDAQRNPNLDLRDILDSAQWPSVPYLYHGVLVTSPEIHTESLKGEVGERIKRGDFLATYQRTRSPERRKSLRTSSHEQCMSLRK